MRLFEATKRKPTINLTPLIDVLFILIIFFVVSSKIIGSQGIGLTLPQSSQGRDQPLSLPILMVTAEGRFLLNKVPVQKETLQKALTEQAGGQGAVIFQIDENIAHGTVVELMGLAKSAGFQRVIFGTESLKE